MVMGKYGISSNMKEYVNMRGIHCEIKRSEFPVWQTNVCIGSLKLLIQVTWGFSD